ncbi:MAG: bifunctional 3-deoxy-7-phosphoheptulonate synthase/chorismate mutase type II [Muribaculaceae bacterium]|nr:bifunctional 3-deoxy-7-phosphoheptulonate synthase/chorismate mutase type II [Muribaculaceae bacterium]
MDSLKPLVDDPSLLCPPLIIAGPCSAESRSQLIDTAIGLSECGIRILRAGVWKPRTKPGCFEGAGEAALRWLADAKAATGMLTATEVATPAHVEAAVSAGVDILWIGARTSANPFAVQDIADALARIGRDIPVLVKNPVNPDLELWIGALQRLYAAGTHRLGAIHRGFSAYGHHTYRNVPQWNIPFELRRRYPALPLLADPSHISGRRDLIAPLSQQALDMGFDGLIIESHIDPDHALSDAAQQITPATLRTILDTIRRRDGSFTKTTEIQLLRQHIDALDTELLEILAKRMDISRQIGRYKKDHNIPVVQTERYDDILRSRISQAAEIGIPDDFVRHIFSLIHEESVRLQVNLLSHDS